MGSVRIVVSSVAAALGVSATAIAAPPVAISVDVDGNPYNYAPVGTPTAFTGVYNYLGSDFQGTWLTTWDFNATDSTAVSLVYISGSFTFQNLSLATQVYDVFVDLTTYGSLLPSSLMGGSVGAGLTTDLDGGFLKVWDAVTPMWSAYVDNTEVHGLLLGTNLSAGPVDSASTSEAFGMPIPNMPGPALGTSLGIRFRFELSAGEQASFTSVFVLKPIPAPAGIALLGLAGFCRRRRA